MQCAQSNSEFGYAQRWGLTEMPAGKAKYTAHDGQEHLLQPISNPILVRHARYVVHT